MDDRKSMGSALVDVFDAGVTLAKTEINGVARKAGEMAKAKGLGVVLLLAATGPLMLALIFLILMVFFFMMRFFHWSADAASLFIAVLSLLVTGGLVVFGMRKLSAEVQTEEPLVRRELPGDPGLNAAPYSASAPMTPASVSRPESRPAGINEKLSQIKWDDAQPTASGASAASSGERRVTLRQSPGIGVSTDPTYREDMQKGGS